MDADQLIEMTPLRPAQRPGVDEEDVQQLRAPEVSARSPPLQPRASLLQPMVSFVGSDAGPRREDLSYIWGTGIAVEVFRQRFRAYLETFHIGEPPVDTAEPPSEGVRRAATGSGHLHVNPLAMARTGEKYYLKELLRMHLQGSTTLELDMTWLQQTEPTLYHQTVNHPTECLQMMSAVVEELYRDILNRRHGIAVAEDTLISLAPKRMPHLITIKQLSPHNVEELISLRGMVIRVSKIIPEIRVACFQCWHCQYLERSVSSDKGRIFEPTRCAHCGKSYSFTLKHNLSLYEDKQLVKVQEAPEHVADGETPISISVVVYGAMVDAVVPGDRIVVTGIYRSSPIRLNANTRIIKSIFSTHVDAVHIEHIRVTRPSTSNKPLSHGISGATMATPTLAMQDESSANKRAMRASTMDTARLDTFHRLAHRADIYDVLLRSFARTIWGHDDVKRGILAQLFGGTPKTFVFGRPTTSTDGDATTSAEGDGGASAGVHEGPAPPPDAGGGRGSSAFFRSELNVILCGDPGVAKSQLLTQVHEIAPRGIYTSGKGSSSVGLTAFVIQDHDTGELVLEPGALVLSDQGLCCIDEFDKMNEATRSVLHEVMEQQTLSVAKAGIIAQLNARTSILAAANPKESQWNVHLNVVENLQIEPTLLSRFDLIFLLLDRHDPAEDRRLASHILSLYMEKHDGQLNTRGAPLSGGDENDGEIDGEEWRHGNASAAVSKPHRGNGDVTSDRQTATDPVTGLAVEVLLQFRGEVFLQGAPGEAYIPPSILSEYIAIARETVFPRLTEQSHKQLAASYVELRRARGNSRTVAATLRQLESMIRLSEARAKMRYAVEVTVEDVQEAKRLISAALKEAATDPKTGLITLDMFHAPDPTKNTVEGNMKRLSELVERRFTALGKTTATVSELRVLLNEHLSGGLRPLDAAQFMELLVQMVGGDVILSLSGGIVTFVSE